MIELLILISPLILLALFVSGIPLVFSPLRKIYLRKTKFLIIYSVLLCLFTLVTFIANTQVALWCGVQKEIYNSSQGYYLHRRPILFPICGTVGVLVYGEAPDGYLTIDLGGLLNEDNQHSVLENSRTIAPAYFIFISFLIAVIPAYTVTFLIFKLLLDPKKF